MPHLGSRRLFDTMGLDLISQMDMFWSTHVFGQPRRQMNWSWKTLDPESPGLPPLAISSTQPLLGWGVAIPQPVITWKFTNRCWNFWPRSEEVLTLQPTPNGSSDGRLWTESDGWTASSLLRLPTSNWSSGDTGSHLESKSWDPSIRRSWRAIWGGNGRNAFWHT